MERRKLIIYGVSLVSAAIAGALIAREGEPSHYTIISNVKRTDGLGLKSRVLLSGAEVGHIEKMELKPDFSVDVHMKIRRGVKVPSDSATAIYSESLLAGKYMAILAGGDDEYMGDGARFDYSQNSINLTDMLVSGLQALKKREKK